jgi:hypothetical protein
MLLAVCPLAQKVVFVMDDSNTHGITRNAAIAEAKQNPRTSSRTCAKELYQTFRCR